MENLFIIILVILLLSIKTGKFCNQNAVKLMFRIIVKFT